MKLGFLIDSVSRRSGGLYDANRFLATQLACGGVDVCVFGNQDSDTQADRSGWHPVNVVTAKSIGPRRFGYSPRLRSYISSYSPDVLHCHGLWTFTSLASLRWAASTRRPYVVHPHGMLDSWAVRNSSFKKRLVGWLFENKHLQGAACIRALCHAELEAIRAFGLKNPVAVIPNGVHLPNLENNSFQRLSDLPFLTGDPKRLLFLGRLHPKKGIQPLLRAWASVRTQLVEDGWQLWLAGWDEGGHEAFLKQLAQTLGIAWTDARESHTANPKASVVFWGPQFADDKASLLQSCNAFILPSFSEGLPMAVLEAWAYGKPVIITPTCNLPEGFEHDAAIRIEPTVDSIAKGLAQMSSMRETARVQMGCLGRQLVQQQFTWSSVAGKISELSHWLVHGGDQPPFVFND